MFRVKVTSRFGSRTAWVRKRNRAAELVEFRRKLSHLHGERLNRDRRKNGVQVFASLPRLFRGLGAMQAMLQFDHSNGREYDFRFAVLMFECGQQLTYRLGRLTGPAN